MTPSPELTLTGHLTLLLLSFAQSVSFSIVSRSRNRDNLSYHVVAAILSNAVWFLTFKNLVTSNMNLAILPTYTVGTVGGSVLGVKISMWFERLLGAASDSHLRKPKAGARETDAPSLHAAVALRIKEWKAAADELTPLPDFLGLEPAQYDAYVQHGVLPAGYRLPPQVLRKAA